MDKIQIETTQNVMLEFELAGVGDRILANVIDWAINLAYLFFSFNIFDYSFSNYSILSSIIIWAPFAFYNLFFEFFLNGQTPGKKALNIRVMKLDGSSPSFGDHFLRWIFRPVEYLFFVGIISMAISKAEQRLGDLASDSTVVRLKKRANLEDTVLKQVTNQDYQPIFKDVLKFSDKDINLIKETLDFARKSGNMERVVKLSQKIKEIHPDVPHMAPMKMLEVVIYDYNYVAQRMNQ